MNHRYSPLERQVADVLRRARRLPIGPDRNDLRQLAVGLLWLHRKGVDASLMEAAPDGQDETRFRSRRFLSGVKPNGALHQVDFRRLHDASSMMACSKLTNRAAEQIARPRSARYRSVSRCAASCPAIAFFTIRLLLDGSGGISHLVDQTA